MLRSVVFLAGILMLASGALAMSGLYVSGTWRYRMTVEVATPEGLKTGSAVHEVSNAASNVKIGFPESGNPADFRGEAVVVDLGARGVLFALLQTDPEEIFYETFPNPNGRSTVQGITNYNRTLSAGMRLPAALTPRLVTFGDITDPMSVRLVDPKDLSATFGSGITLEAITLEITREQPTFGVVTEWLPWLRPLDGGYLDGRFSGGGPHLSNILHGGNFERKE